MLSVVGKLFGRVLITRVRDGTECAIGEEQCGYRQGRGCIDQVFAVRQVCEKYLSKLIKYLSLKLGEAKICSNFPFETVVNNRIAGLLFLKRFF